MRALIAMLGVALAGPAHASCDEEISPAYALRPADAPVHMHSRPILGFALAHALAFALPEDHKVDA